MKKEDHDIRHQRLPHEAHAHLPRRPSHDEFVHNVVRLIIASMPARRHGVAEIASSLSLGEQTFRRHIFAATGLAPKDFITSVQMREAARLLIDCQDVRIRDVGCRCGFDDASAFTNAFKNQKLANCVIKANVCGFCKIFTTVNLGLLLNFAA